MACDNHVVELREALADFCVRFDENEVELNRIYEKRYNECLENGHTKPAEDESICLSCYNKLKKKTPCYSKRLGGEIRWYNSDSMSFKREWNTVRERQKHKGRLIQIMNELEL